MKKYKHVFSFPKNRISFGQFNRRFYCGKGKDNEKEFQHEKTGLNPLSPLSSLANTPKEIERKREITLKIKKIEEKQKELELLKLEKKLKLEKEKQEEEEDKKTFFGYTDLLLSKTIDTVSGTLQFTSDVVSGALDQTGKILGGSISTINQEIVEKQVPNVLDLPLPQFVKDSSKDVKDLTKSAKNSLNFVQDVGGE